MSIAYNTKKKSQYTDSITGDVVFDMRCISNHIVDFAKENYPKSNMVDSSTVYTPEQNYTVYRSYRMDSGKRLFDHPSIYLSNYGLNTTPDSQNYSINDFTFSLWVYPISIGSRYSAFGTNFIIGNRDYIQLCYAYDISNGSGNISPCLYASYYPDTGSKVILNTWNHVAMTLKGDILRAYLNGTKIYQSTITPQTSLLRNIEIACMNTDSSYIGEAVIIAGQALWTGDTYEVPNTFLTGEKEFESKYVIYTAPMNGWPNITGTVVCDFRANKKYLYETCCNKNRFFTISPGTSPITEYGSITPVYDKNANFEYAYKFKRNASVGIYNTSSNPTDARNILSNTWTACQWLNVYKAPTIPYTSSDGPEGCYSCTVRFVNGNQLDGYFIDYHTNEDRHKYPYYYATEFGTCKGNETFASLEGQWQFIVWVKTSSKLYLFKNGILLKEANVTKDYSGALKFTAMTTYSVVDNKMEIRYRNLVIINGQALWTSNFTPPTGYLDEPKFTKAMILKRNNNDSDINLY